jgi:CHRD domain-containing protein
MTRLVVHALAFAAALSLSASAQSPQYRARLAMVPTDLAMQATIAGLGSATASLKGSTLTVSGAFSGLKTPATVVRVHRSAKPGMRGAAIGELKATEDTSGTITGSIELTKEQADDLAAGRLYIQLHSQKAPDGNLWGWLQAVEKK